MLRDSPSLLKGDWDGLIYVHKFHLKYYPMAPLFAHDIQVAFQSIIHSKKIKGGEIQLFRALISAFKQAHQATAKIEEYHGTNHQVTFTGNGSFARTSARCELSDLLIIAFNSNEARLTYLQAKYERNKISNIDTHQWSANLEQWFLLNMRPTINGVGDFNPPSDLLSSAILKSIGSFGFFYKNNKGFFDLYYASAEHLNLPKIYTQKNGKLIINRTTLSRHLLDQIIKIKETECLEAPNLYEFLINLYNLQIGSPILRDQYLSKWIIEVLKTIPPTPIINQLLNTLLNQGNDDNHDFQNYEKNERLYSFGAKKLLIIQIADQNTTTN